MKRKNLLVAFFDVIKNKGNAHINIKKHFILPSLLLVSFIIIYIYVLATDAIPEKIILFQGEELKYKKVLGLSIENENINKYIQASVIEANNEIGTKKLKLKLFNKIDLKDIDVSIIERTKVIPVGQVAGIKMYTSGVLVVGMSEIKGEDNEKHKPYENTGIKEGDTIIEIEDTEITDTKKLVEIVNQFKGKKLEIKYLHQGEILNCSITPTKTSKAEYKLGLWVRDSAAGIGTLTYYEPETKKFAALGHGITDIDTGELLNISNGEFITTKVLSIIKGQNGNPGKIQGSISEQTKIGTINKNSIFGIYGTIDDVSKVKINTKNTLDVALRNEIELGNAQILCTLDEENVEKYNIEIEKIYINNDYDNKSMLIKVTDERLIQKTGGIIQGMSGSPVIQNGKFIGAVTNVLVNDPTKGYVVFGDIMIKEMKSIAK